MKLLANREVEKTEEMKRKVVMETMNTQTDVTSTITNADIWDLLIGFAGAIALDQIRVDELPKKSLTRCTTADCGGVTGASILLLSISCCRP